MKIGCTLEVLENCDVSEADFRSLNLVLAIVLKISFNMC